MQEAKDLRKATQRTESDWCLERNGHIRLPQVHVVNITFKSVSNIFMEIQMMTAV